MAKWPSRALYDNSPNYSKIFLVVKSEAPAGQPTLLQQGRGMTSGAAGHLITSFRGTEMRSLGGPPGSARVNRGMVGKPRR